MQVHTFEDENGETIPIPHKRVRERQETEMETDYDTDEDSYEEENSDHEDPNFSNMSVSFVIILIIKILGFILPIVWECFYSKVCLQSDEEDLPSQQTAAREEVPMETDEVVTLEFYSKS